MFTSGTINDIANIMDIGGCNKTGNWCEPVTSVFVRLATSPEGPVNEYFHDEAVWKFLRGIGRMFYIVKPTHTTYEMIEDVPNFYRDVSLFFYYLYVPK